MPSTNLLNLKESPLEFEQEALSTKLAVILGFESADKVVNYNIGDDKDKNKATEHFEIVKNQLMNLLDKIYNIDKKKFKLFNTYKENINNSLLINSSNNDKLITLHVVQNVLINVYAKFKNELSNIDATEINSYQVDVCLSGAAENIIEICQKYLNNGFKDNLVYAKKKSIKQLLEEYARSKGILKMREVGNEMHIIAALYNLISDDYGLLKSEDSLAVLPEKPNEQMIDLHELKNFLSYNVNFATIIESFISDNPILSGENIHGDSINNVFKNLGIKREDLDLFYEEGDGDKTGIYKSVKNIDIKYKIFLLKKLAEQNLISPLTKIRERNFIIFNKNLYTFDDALTEITLINEDKLRRYQSDLELGFGEIFNFINYHFENLPSCLSGTLKSWIQKGGKFPPDHQDELTSKLIYYCIEKDQQDLFNYLISDNAQLTNIALDYYGSTPLQIAIRKDRTEIIKKLLEHKEVLTTIDLLASNNFDEYMNLLTKLVTNRNENKEVLLAVIKAKAVNDIDAIYLIAYYYIGKYIELLEYFLENPDENKEILNTFINAKYSGSQGANYALTFIINYNPNKYMEILKKLLNAPHYDKEILNVLIKVHDILASSSIYLLALQNPSKYIKILKNLLKEPEQNKEIVSHFIKANCKNIATNHEAIYLIAQNNIDEYIKLIEILLTKPKISKEILKYFITAKYVYGKSHTDAIYQIAEKKPDKYIQFLEFFLTPPNKDKEILNIFITAKKLTNTTAISRIAEYNTEEYIKLLESFLEDPNDNKEILNIFIKSELDVYHIAQHYPDKYEELLQLSYEKLGTDENNIHSLLNDNSKVMTLRGSEYINPSAPLLVRVLDLVVKGRYEVSDSKKLK